MNLIWNAGILTGLTSFLPSDKYIYTIKYTKFTKMHSFLLNNKV